MRSQSQLRNDKYIMINVLLWCRNCSEAFSVCAGALSVIQSTTLPFDLNRSFTKTRFRCNFCSDKSVQTWLGPFQKPIRYGTSHFQQRSGAVLFQSRKRFESSVPSVNRSPIQHTFCDAPFHYPAQCEHSLKSSDIFPHVLFRPLHGTFGLITICQPINVRFFKLPLVF